MPQLDPTAVETRRRKRLVCVATVKGLPEYRLCEGLAAKDRHKEPDPHDQTIAKRRWEIMVKIWRKKLRAVALMEVVADID